MILNRIITLLCLVSILIARQIILVKQNNKYVFKLDIQNLKVSLNSLLSLQHKKSWIKSQTCKYCRLIANQDLSKIKPEKIQKINQQNFDCSKSCFEKSDQQYGLKCSQINKNCEVLKSNTQIQRDSKILKGNQILLKVKDQINHQKFDDFQLLLVDKIFDKQQITKTKQFNSIGEYSIWGQNSLFQSNVITKNNKNQITIFDGIKQSQLQKQLSQIKPIQIQFEQTITQFTLSQIKFIDQITLNNPQKIIEDHQFSILPLSKGFFTLKTQNLIIPQKQFKKVTKYIIQTLFQTENNKCQLKNTTISCEKSIDLDKTNYLQLQLILNGISLGFPFQVLLKNCKGKSCDIKLESSSNSQNFSLGTFILDVFAIQFVDSTENIKLHRLNNQWSHLYSKNQKYRRQNFNIFWWFITSTFYLIYYLFKIIFYLAIFSLCINFLYHWRKVLQWLIKIFNKLAKRQTKQQGQLFEQQEDMEVKDTSKLIKRLKNKKNKGFPSDQQILTDSIEKPSNLQQH